MKIITTINWGLLLFYGGWLIYWATTVNQTASDLAGRGMAKAYLIIGFVLWVVIVGVNCLPFRLTKLAVFAGLALLLLNDVARWITQFTASKHH